MVNTVVASLALFGASAAALSVGSAIVVNSCNYDVHLFNVPAAFGGYEESDEVLSSGSNWTTQWTELTNGAGWSIKLAKPDDFLNIMQYEYTFQNDGTIWYDLSDVNGNPWNANWEITADSDDCNPNQQAYRYATDDAYGMQSCPQDSTITVTLCSGESQSDGVASSLSSSAAAESTAAPSTYTPESTAAPSTTAEAEATQTHGHDHHHGYYEAQESPSPTTLATVAAQQGGFTITEYETHIEVVTAAPKEKRHEHRHPHQRV